MVSQETVVLELEHEQKKIHAKASLVIAKLGNGDPFSLPRCPINQRNRHSPGCLPSGPISPKGCQTESDEAWIPPVVRRTLLQIPQDPTLTHEYLPELGVPEFNRAATELVLGKYSRALLDNRAGGVQTIGGTGAVFIGAEFLRRWYKPNSSTSTAVYIAIPQLGSLGCIFQTAGFNDIRPYQYWDPVKLTVNIQQFLLDLQKKHLFPFFDVAAQGLASGNLDRDAWALRHFVARGFELLCAQSFSKTFGLYEERVGNLIVVTKDNETLIRIQSQLAKQVTMIWYGPTSLGARLITMVLNSPALLYEWKENLLTLVKRIMLMREKLKEKLRILGTPGSWEHLTAQAGTNSFIGLLPSQVEFLEKQKHIYLLPNNQINICSINSKNLDYIAQSIHEAVMSG
ncbi:putative aspartate aminotransferase, cytoplasmic 2 isoform X3 [Hemicordylus capensis]|uniref:putative aspartate aminotransferase, cytoplasmic 2 isoform X3 n=1 Tax=Hemicordylus capensis TaxID=884348 RepID=UPI0023021ED4|nr:putative aspartate aminotransferase, cytoplasmic 2 isoform X3 [Hemicordylus capensis]